MQDAESGAKQRDGLEDVWARVRAGEAEGILFGKTDRFLQTATAVLGTGVVLGLGMFLPVQWLLTQAAVPPESTTAGLIALGMVMVFALVTGRIVKLATDSNLFTGVTLSLTYFLLINLLLHLASGGGG